MIADLARRCGRTNHPENDDSAGVAPPTPSVEHITKTASQQIGRVS